MMSYDGEIVLKKASDREGVAVRYIGCSHARLRATPCAPYGYTSLEYARKQEGEDTAFPRFG